MSVPRTVAEAYVLGLDGAADLKARCVIYLILCLANGKGYVGQTRRQLKNRRVEHRGGFKDPSDKKRNGDSALSAAFRKYGWNSFLYYVIEICLSSDELNSREPFWINKLETLAPTGYNLMTGGNASHQHQSTKEKLRIINKNKKMPLEAIEKTRQANLGRIKSDEERRRIGDGVRGFKHTAETKKKIGIGTRVNGNAARGGRRMHDLYAGSIWINNGPVAKRVKLENGIVPEGWKLGRGRGTTTGMKASDATKLKLSISHLGQKVSLATKLKHSISKFGRVWINNGVINKFVHIENIPDGWQRGMKKK